MGTAYFSDSYSNEYNGDLTIARGLSTVWFDPGGDPLGATVEEVRFKLHIDHNGGQPFDLGDVDMWIVSPDGERNRIYYNFDGPGQDTDDGNDSDGANDYDISFWGTDLISSIKFGLDGNPVNGDWGLRIDNQTGITLDLNYLEVWVDYNSAPDLIVRDIRLSGVGGNEVGTPMLIETWIENTGDTRYGDRIDLEYLVNDVVIGTGEVSFGLNGGSVNYETELHTFDQYGDNKVTVRIVGADDPNRSNNSRTEFFAFSQPDLVVSDVRVLGDWGAGEEIEIRAFIENIGDDAWNLLNGAIRVEYSINGNVVGTDSLSLGLTPYFGDWESFDFTLTSDAPVTVGVRVFGDDPEVTTANNRWQEEFGHDHHDPANQKTVANSAFDVQMSSFLVHTVYGLDSIPEDFRETDRDGNPVENNGIDADYRGYLADFGWTVLDDGDLGQLFRPNHGKGEFRSGGLFNGDAQDINIFTSFASQGLLAVGTSPDGERTLTLTFRGTDGDDMVDSSLGQAWTGDGIYNYYEAMRPLIDAAIGYANRSSNGIDKMIVSGHSLGGATADLFTLVDAHRLKSDIDLTVVSIASAGLNPNALEDSFTFQGMRDQYDDRLVSFAADGTMTLNAPSYYIGLSFSNDTVTFDIENPTQLPLVPNFTLNNNVNFDDGLIAIDLPHIAPDDPVDGGLLDQLGFGAEHDHGLYWAMLGALARDPLVSLVDGHAIVMGETDYAAVTTLGGDPLGVFAKFADVKPSGYEHDSGSKTLTGSGGADYILGLDGDDVLAGRAGNDLLSGGNGDDTLSGGAGADALDGGAGFDTADYSGAAARIKVDLMNLAANLGDALGDSFGAIERWIGSLHNDALLGDNGANVLGGIDGDDQLLGRGGRDLLLGDDGNDLIRGGYGRDTIEGGLGDDSLFGSIGHDRIIGGRGADRLDGGWNNDMLLGGFGNDTLIGGRGDDNIGGGAGSDTFIFATGHGIDIVADFDATDANEKLDLSGIAALTGLADITDPGGAGSQVGDDVLIDTGAGNSILLRNVLLADLDATDFLF
ncbi:hypothetical protein KUH32_12495 [Thalassococcus sp. CAU 1522]|uniref:Fungal lipase-type domain-containing protein n=1 Tax=Thalassococcus arenae TaxID=2851652 RepID=A0ABS6N9C1_9RHOB|nr:hypothetical protein [Thalassococcus arenae]MBV2360597.1 hypothetical protein [Thalassococcus arenae]